MKILKTHIGYGFHGEITDTRVSIKMFIDDANFFITKVHQTR